MKTVEEIEVVDSDECLTALDQLDSRPAITKVEAFLKMKKSVIWEEFEVVPASLEGTFHVTSNVCYNRIGVVEMELVRWCNNMDDVILRNMARSMKIKFYKYWGSVEKINPLMLISVILDPRYKLGYLRYIFDTAYPFEIAMDMEFKVKDHLARLYEAYSAEIPVNMAETGVESTSESVFSTGGRVLSNFRSSLHWETAEGLICLQNWLGPNTNTIESKEILEELIQSKEIAASTSTCSKKQKSPMVIDE
ncbi:zinc finger BED domain-containing protein RICESLEEPER 2-like [Quillaja saponaria]|uniref:Zinc finger BED domain-containing protein RICESLEEPER 2-like n=1 Tax=Quillaja saponaria TaxID=32244 RepID=A0AAD7L1A4_QUISA|nr:zinc finger BED domain-containing protein RICESLEEPER 2-like [Quillaja saponaria]